MRVVVIGGTGHIGSYLIPRLVRNNHHVSCITRGTASPYFADAAWSEVSLLVVDREKEDETNTFGKRIRDLHPDVVIDLVCFSESSARKLVEPLRGQIQLLIHFGTIWVHGPSVAVPTNEDQPRHPFGDYGIQKAAIETYLLREANKNRFPVSILHPGHIVGRGWWPLNPIGNFNPEVFRKLAKGEEIILPNLGMETVHHVHADDLAHSFMQAISFQSMAVGEAFHIVSDQALTLRGYAEYIGNWFGKPANLKYLPWDEFKNTISDEEAAITWDHIAHSPNCSNRKARKLLDYSPRFSSFEAIVDSLEYLRSKNEF